MLVRLTTRMMFARFGAHALAALLGAAALASTGASNASPLVWSTEVTQPARFMAVHGRRAAIFGYSSSGLEAWAYPLQIFSSFNVSMLPHGAATEIEGKSILRRM